MKQHFLHLSDLHFRTDWPEETELVCARLLEDLAVRKSQYPNAYLIFSGDLVQAGGDDGLYSAFEKRFSNSLTDAGFPVDRRICIPGNHDISRSKLKPKVTVQQGALSVMTDERTFNNNMPLLSEQYFIPTFNNYVACEKQFARYTCCDEGLGGQGWELPNGIGIYCLNTALCSFGGLEDDQGKKIVDKGRLFIDTRSLYRWLQENTSATRILVMHHPIDWLADWARDELEKIIAESFCLVVSGHVHMAAADYSSRGAAGSVHCVAPALFTRKSETLGYSFITLDGANIEVSYRQWTPTHKFVAGTVLADSDTGVKTFPTVIANRVTMPDRRASNPPDTLAILQEEYDEALTCYSSKKKIWVERDLAPTPETTRGQKGQVITTATALSENFRSCVVRAPKQFGLTCLGRFLALRCSEASNAHGVVAMMDALAITPHRDGVTKYVRRRCAELQADQATLQGVILDNWQNDKRSGIILREIQLLLPKVPVVILQGIDNVAEIADSTEINELESFDSLYLWSMTRTRIRELVSAYVQDLPTLDENAVTKKVTEEIDSLNLHRTPLRSYLKCLLGTPRVQV